MTTQQKLQYFNMLAMCSWENRAQVKDCILSLYWVEGRENKKLQTKEVRRGRRKIQIQDSTLLRNRAGYSVPEDVSWKDTRDPLCPDRVHLWSESVKNKSAERFSCKSFIGSKFASISELCYCEGARACTCPAAIEPAAAINLTRQVPRRKCHLPTLGRQIKRIYILGKQVTVVADTTSQPKKSGVGIWVLSGHRTVGWSFSVDVCLVRAFGEKACPNNQHA